MPLPANSPGREYGGSNRSADSPPLVFGIGKSFIGVVECRLKRILWDPILLDGLGVMGDRQLMRGKVGVQLAAGTINEPKGG